MKRFAQNKGFTLIELLTVVAIIGILSGIVLQSIKNYREKTYNTMRFAHIDQIEKALQIYLTKTGDGANFPTSSGWDCIGTNNSCWGGAIPSNIGTTPATNINLALEGNISEIPKDPFFAGVNGDYYIYISGNLAVSSSFPSGPGAYIHWYSKNTGSTPCGRGSIVTVSDPVRCTLFLGKD